MSEEGRWYSTHLLLMRLLVVATAPLVGLQWGMCLYHLCLNVDLVMVWWLFQLTGSPYSAFDSLFHAPPLSSVSHRVPGRVARGALLVGIGVNESNRSPEA